VLLREQRAAGGDRAQERQPGNVVRVRLCGGRFTALASDQLEGTRLRRVTA